MRPDNDILRFLDAQDTEWSMYDEALREVRRGRKNSHWIWYIFPQLRGLGHSWNSHYYGIADRSEAEAYVRHPVLGARLREISEALLMHTDKTAIDIFGAVDAKKVKSCMTLFDCVLPDDVFARVLHQFYGGTRDSRSLV